METLPLHFVNFGAQSFVLGMERFVLAHCILRFEFVLCRFDEQCTVRLLKLGQFPFEIDLGLDEMSVSILFFGQVHLEVDDLLFELADGFVGFVVLLLLLL